MASRAARDMASCMKSGGKAKSKMPPQFAKKAPAKPGKVAPAPMPLKLAAGGVAKIRHEQSTPAGKQKSPPKKARMAL